MIDKAGRKVGSAGMGLPLSILAMAFRVCGFFRDESRPGNLGLDCGTFSQRCPQPRHISCHA